MQFAIYLVNVAQGSLLDAVVLNNLTENAAIATANDQDLLGVGVGVHGEVGDHLLVGELVALGGLDNIVQDQNSAVIGRLEDEDILILALLVVQDLVNLEGHGLAWARGISFVIKKLICGLALFIPGHMSEISRNQPSVAALVKLSFQPWVRSDTTVTTTRRCHCQQANVRFSKQHAA